MLRAPFGVMSVRDSVSPFQVTHTAVSGSGASLCKHRFSLGSETVRPGILLGVKAWSPLIYLGVMRWGNRDWGFGG